MKPEENRKSRYTQESKERSLPGHVLLDLLQAVLDKNVPFRFQATGFSMYPFIWNKDILTISPLFGHSPRFGDVVGFISPDKKILIVHRVIGKKENTFLIKGDNISDFDGFIPETNIIGRVTRVERGGKRVLLGLGLERILIAFLTRKGFLIPLLYLGMQLTQFLRKSIISFKNLSVI